MKESRRWTNLLALLVASALVLAACGGGGRQEDVRFEPSGSRTRWPANLDSSSVDTGIQPNHGTERNGDA